MFSPEISREIDLEARVMALESALERALRLLANGPPINEWLDWLVGYYDTDQARPSETAGLDKVSRQMIANLAGMYAQQMFKRIRSEAIASGPADGDLVWVASA